MMLTLLGVSSPLKARPITISEINFDRREFIEFYNHTEIPIDLTGYTVIGGEPTAKRGPRAEEPIPTLMAWTMNGKPTPFALPNP